MSQRGAASVFVPGARERRVSIAMSTTRSTFATWTALLAAWGVPRGSESEVALATAVVLDAHRYAQRVLDAAHGVLGMTGPGAPERPPFQLRCRGLRLLGGGRRE